MSLERVVIEGDSDMITVTPAGVVMRRGRSFATLQDAFDIAQDEMTPLYDLLEEANGRSQTQAPA